MSIIFRVLIVFSLFSMQVCAQSIIFSNPVGKDFSQYEIISINRSIMSCGDRSGFSIYTSLDIQAILAISNFLSDDKVSLSTDWNSFLPMKYNPSSVGLSEKDISNFPDDVKRILFICTTWDESHRLKLFLIPKEAIENIANTIKKQKPWSVLNSTVSTQLDNFTDATIREFVYLVLRANVYQSIKGGINKNPTLWSTPFSWRIINRVSDSSINDTKKEMESKN